MRRNRTPTPDQWSPQELSRSDSRGLLCSPSPELVRVTRNARGPSIRPMLLRPEYLSQTLDCPLPTKDGGTLRTIGEACTYMTGMDKKRKLRQHWQRACQLILAKADVQPHGLSPHLRKASRRSLRGEGQWRVGIRSAQQNSEQSAPDLGFHVCAPFKFDGQPDHLYCVVVPPET
jgi:hypothetical protein